MRLIDADALYESLRESGMVFALFRGYVDQRLGEGGTDET